MITDNNTAHTSNAHLYSVCEFLNFFVRRARQQQWKNQKSQMTLFFLLLLQYSVFFLLLSCRTMIMSAAMRLFRYVAAGACVCVHSTLMMCARKRRRTYRRQCAIPWLHEWNGKCMCVVYKIVIFRAWCVYVCAGITDEKEMSKTLLREIAKQMIGNCQNRIGIYIALGS